MGTDGSFKACESTYNRHPTVVTVAQRADTSELAMSRLAQLIGRQIAREEFKAQQARRLEQQSQKSAIDPATGS